MRFAGKSLHVFLPVLLFLSLLFPMRAFAEETPQIHTDVTQSGQKRDSFAVGQSHSWIVRADIPHGLEAAGEYVIVQTLSPCLSYEAGSLDVSVLNERGREVRLEMEEHYSLTAGAVAEGGNTADRICVSLTREGMAYAAENAELMICYRAAINEHASMGIEISGMAQLYYTDAENQRYSAISDKAAVYTGGISIALTDDGNLPLSGGKFMIAHPASDEEIGDPAVVKELLDTGKEMTAVVYDTFFTDKSWERKTDIAVTRADGTAMLCGLAYGTYYLVQIEAPEGKSPMAEPVPVVVDEVSHLTAKDGWKDSVGRPADHTLRITNAGILMPRTGGPGTKVYTFLGIGLILSACMLMWSNRKRRART